VVGIVVTVVGFVVVVAVGVVVLLKVVLVDPVVLDVTLVEVVVVLHAIKNVVATANAKTRSFFNIISLQSYQCK